MRRQQRKFPRHPGLSPGRTATIRNLTQRLTTDLGRAPTDSEIALTLAMSAEWVRRHRAAIGRAGR